MLCVYRYSSGVEQHVGSPEAGVKGGCELISVGVASQANVLNCRATSPGLIYVVFFFSTISRATNINDMSQLQHAPGKAHFYSRRMIFTEWTLSSAWITV